MDKCAYDLFNSNRVVIDILEGGAAGELCYLLMKSNLQKLERSYNGSASRPVMVELTACPDDTPRISVFYICLPSRKELEQQVSCIRCGCDKVSVRWVDANAEYVPLVTVTCPKDDFIVLGDRLNKMVSERRSPEDDLYAVVLVDDSGEHYRCRYVKQDVFDALANQKFVGCKVRKDGRQGKG